MPPGQLIVGCMLSTTVTLKEQAGPAVVVQFTVVSPTGKVEFAGGVQVTVPQSVACGAGYATAAPH